MTSGEPDLPFSLPDVDVILDQIHRDAAAARFDRWGASTAIDEIVGRAVVPEDVFSLLHEAAGIPADFPLGNAGVMHVYGYWFSTVRTPFGFKRDRWTDGALARAYGLPREAFRWESDAATTPLERVTDAAGRLLATSGESGELAAEVMVEGARTRAVLGPRVEGVSALVYGIDEGDGVRLITTFPVNGDRNAFLEAFVSDPRLHWNAERHSTS